MLATNPMLMHYRFRAGRTPPATSDARSSGIVLCRRRLRAPMCRAVVLPASVKSEVPKCVESDGSEKLEADISASYTDFLFSKSPQSGMAEKWTVRF